MKIKKITLKTRGKVLKRKLSNYLYKQIIRNIMFTSRIGRRTILGYADSGITFDKIYQNTPRGYSLFGTLVEYILLRLPVSKATRNRQINLKRIINQEIENNFLHGKRTKILNLASGPARYLLELISNKNREHVEILCLDEDLHCISLGRYLSGKLPVRFLKANVFKLNHLKRIGKRKKWVPNLILASGLYFYNKDEVVRDSFYEVKTHLSPGGLFIFDHLIDNPNRRLLAKICKMRSGKNWEFYYRKPNIIIPWLKENGFVKIETLRDRWNMYCIYKSRCPL